MNQTQVTGASVPPTVIRPATGADSAALAELLTGLSDLSLYFRFQTAIGRPPRPAVLDRLLNPRGGSWVATRGAAIIGHAMWAWAGPVPSTGRPGRTAELAVLVGDQEQGRGLGTQLLVEAGRNARDSGAGQLLFVVSAANDRVARKIRRTWPTVGAERNGDLIDFRIPAAALDALVPTIELDLPAEVPAATRILV